MKNPIFILIMICLTMVFLWSCQKELPIPIVNDDLSQNVLKMGNGNGNNGNGKGNGGNHQTYDVDLIADGGSTITSSSSGIAGSTLFVSFPNGSINIVIQTPEGPLTLSYGPSFSVNVNSQGIPDNVQFWVKEMGGKSYPLYTTGPVDIDPDGVGNEIPDGDFIFHMHHTFDLWRLKKFNGGPPQEMVGTFTLDDLYFVVQP